MTGFDATPRSENASFCEYPGCDHLHFVNVPLLRKIWDQIVADPKSWSQPYWASSVVKNVLGRNALGRFQSTSVVCGTAYCVAGWAAQFTNHRLLGLPAVGEAAYSADDITEISSCQLPDSEQDLSIEDVATHELGLSLVEAGLLFDGDNSMQTIKQVMQDIVRERAGEEF